MHDDTYESQPQDDAEDAEAAQREELRAKRMAIVEAFSDIVKGKRKDAIEARRLSGIEKTWEEDENHYDGIDEASSETETEKGKNTTDGLRDKKREKPTRSTAFLRITRPYVDAAAARVSDMLLPTDDRNFAIKPEPKPELTELIKQAEQNAGQPATPPAKVSQPGPVRQALGRMFGGGQPAQALPAQPAPADPVAEARQVIAKAKASAERAQETIDDWLVECRYHAEIRKVIESAAKVGTGILKGPHPVMMRRRAAKEVANTAGVKAWQVEIMEKTAPQSKFISQWNLYPDGACGNNIHDGSYIFECDDITRRLLSDLKKDPTYIHEMIDLCLTEGPISPVTGTRKDESATPASDKDLFQIWYFHGQVTKADMEAAGCKISDKKTYPAMVTMVNDHVIKVTLSPLDSGEFPYDVMVWQAKNDHWAGVGVARQMRECQKGANAAVRNLMDNAALSAGPQVIVDRTKIVPANGKWEIVPRKVWYTKTGEEVADVSKAFIIITIETRQAEIMNIIMFWLKQAEDTTGLPMLLQGQQGGAPDTVGGMQIINNNGSTVLRRIARTFDDRITEPHIGRYYEYLLLYGPDEAKGQFTVDARGSSALVERDLQGQQLGNLLALSLNSAYGMDPELIAKEFLKAQRFDTNAIMLSDEKKAEMASRPPPEDPRITAAKIAAASRDKATDTSAKVKGAEIQGKFRAADADRALAQWVAQIDQQLRSQELSADERQHLESMKVELAGLTLKLRTQKDLSLGAHAIDLHKHRTPQVASPAVEPAGRAPAGQAFTQ